MKKLIILVCFVFIFGSVLFISCRKNHPPEIPSTPGGPNTGYAGVLYNFTTSTTDPDENDVAFQFDWGDGNRTDWSSYIKHNTPFTILKSWSMAGTYLIRARAKNTKEKTSEWSGEHQITIYSNNIPNIPSTPNGPSTGGINFPYSFTTLTTDPDNDSISYQFDWGNGTVSNWSNFVRSGTSITMSASWSDFGTYLIKARAKDIKGAISNWSNKHQFSVISGNFPPNTPDRPCGTTLTYILRTEAYTTTTIDPNNDSVFSIWDWGDNNVDTTDYIISGGGFTCCHVWQNPGTYSIKVQAVDDEGASSDWSDPLIVTVLYR